MDKWQEVEVLQGRVYQQAFKPKKNELESNHISNKN